MTPFRMGVLAGVLMMAATAAQGRSDVVVGLQFEPPHLDPTSAAAGAVDQVLYANVFEGLTRFGPDGSVGPGLAQSWEIDDGGRVHVFHLRPGVRFHDGTRFDARDVKFSLDRARDETSQNPRKALFEGIESVEVMDDLTVRITLAAPDGGFVSKLATGDAAMVAPESITEIREKPVGTGAFRFGNWVLGERITLVRNPDYWGAPARLERATFRFFSEPAAAFAALAAGEVDAFPNFPATENLAQFAADPRYQVLVGTTESETILAINNRRKPFDDVRVREALARAIDRRAVIEGATFGLGTPIGTHFAPHHPDYVDLTELSRHDLARARALLAEAGHAEGFVTTLKLPPSPYARRAGEIVAAELRAVGIEARIVKLEWAEWLNQVFRGKDFGLTIVSHAEPFDIGLYAHPETYFQYDSAAFRELDAALTAEPDPVRRGRLLAAMQRRIALDYANVFLFQVPAVTVADARLRGLWRNAPAPATDLTGVYWAR